MTEDFITIATYRQAVEAHLAKSLLENEGIECYLENEDMGWLYSGVVSVLLKVRESEAEDALRILESEHKENEFEED